MALHKLVVISLDSMGFRDLDEFREFVPHLDQLIKRGTWVKRVRGIFPTLTYPSHTSIITGQYPAIHGIVNNTKFNHNANRLIGTGTVKMLRQCRFMMLHVKPA